MKLTMFALILALQAVPPPPAPKPTIPPSPPRPTADYGTPNPTQTPTTLPPAPTPTPLPPGATPVLTDMQKLVLQSKMKDLKIAELTVQQALTSYKIAQTEFNAAVVALQQPCYDLKDDLTFERNDKKEGCKK